MPCFHPLKTQLAIAIIVLLACGIGLAEDGNSPDDNSNVPGSRRIKEFCAYGVVDSTAITPAFGIYEGGPWEWFECTTKPNNNPIPDGSIGVVFAYPQGFYLGDDLVLEVPFVGTYMVTTMDDDDPEEIAGELVFSIPEGTIYIDLDAAHAQIDPEAGIITIRRHETKEPIPKLVLVEATGMYRNLHQVGPWHSMTQGDIQIALLPEVDPQDLIAVQMNIFAAIEDDTLIVGASEEYVHFGAYYRGPRQSSP